MNIFHRPARAAVLTLLSSALLAAAPTLAHATLPDPLVRGPFTVTTLSVTPPNLTANPPIAVGLPEGPVGAPGDPAEVTLGLVSLEEPNGSSTPPTGTTNGASTAVQLQVRGSLYYPSNDTTPAPLIMLVHGNHSSCATGSAPNCTLFERNDTGYAYLAANLASWGYVVFSLDQDQLIQFQDGSYGKGMHQRRLLIAAALDGLYAANQPGGIPIDANDNIGTKLVGRIDFSRIGLMGHSRGGDAVASFLEYNRQRPYPGRRYAIRAVFSLAPVDYERTAPYGVVYGAGMGACDGDVSNLAGTRMFARSLRIMPTDPFPRIMMILQGANHDAFNTEWDSDGDDASAADTACGPALTTDPNSIRLEPVGNSSANGNIIGNYTHGKTAASPGSTFWQDSPALMGDQQKAGLAMMAEFFRRYVGGETPFDPYMTGEVSGDGVTPQLPASACPTSAPGASIPCFDRLSTTYFAAPQERMDVIDPSPDTPTTVSALGTAINSGGFDYAYANSPGVYPLPPTTPTGLDWCNPEPMQFTPSQLGIGSTNTPVGAPAGAPPTNYPIADKSCPLPAYTALGGQQGTRENAPANHSYQLQLSVAWNNPVQTTGSPAYISTRIPALDGDVSGYKALAMDAAVNFFDPRNPSRGTIGIYNPMYTTQNFTISLTDAEGDTATVQADSSRYGLALHQTLGSTSVHVHIILQEIRVPLSDFAAQGVDLHNIRNLELTFGDTSIPGMNATGSIQLANVRFQEAVSGPTVFADTPNANGPAAPPALVTGDPSDPAVALGLDPTPEANPNGPDPAQIIDNTPRIAPTPDLPDVVWLDGGGIASQAAATAAVNSAGLASVTDPSAAPSTPSDPSPLSGPLTPIAPAPGAPAAPAAPTPELAPPASAPSSPSSPACSSAPVAKIVSARYVHGQLTLGGTASEASCLRSPVSLVEVVVYKSLGHGLCRDVTGSGKLTAPLACAGTLSISVEARGTKSWSLRLPKSLAKGHYDAFARAIDTLGREQPPQTPIGVVVA